MRRPTYYDFWKAKLRWPILVRIEDAAFAVDRLKMRLQGRCTQCGLKKTHKMDCSYG